MDINKLKSNKFLRWLFRKPAFFTADNTKIKGVEIGAFTYGLPIIGKVTDTYSLKIGRFCSIADNVRIFVDSDHNPDSISTYPFANIFKDIPEISGRYTGNGNMEIGNDVWIGSSVLILPGVTIGDGAIVGAGSIVTKNIEDYEIVGGNPAKHIRHRFSPEQIKSLKKIAWWNWDLQKIKKDVPLLLSENIDEFIKKHEIN